MIGSSEECNKRLQVLIGCACRKDAVAPCMERPGMHAPEFFPTVQILQSNGQIFRVRLDMPGNALPSDRAVFAEEVMVAAAHLLRSMPMKTPNAKCLAAGFVLASVNGVNRNRQPFRSSSVSKTALPPSPRAIRC